MSETAFNPKEHQASINEVADRANWGSEVQFSQPDWSNPYASDEDIAPPTFRSWGDRERAPRLSDYPEGIGSVAADAWINGDF